MSEFIVACKSMCWQMHVCLLGKASGLGVDVFKIKVKFMNCWKKRE